MKRPVALVTGGSRGIGLSIARALALEGWDVAICGRRPREEVVKTLGNIKGPRNTDAEYWPADISRPEDRGALLDAVVARFGVPHLLVNNAGRAPSVRADLLDATEDSFEEVLRTNLQGPYFLTQAVARLMIEHQASRGGNGDNMDDWIPKAIVFITSISAEMASPNRGEYCVSKAGLSMTARLFALRLAPHQIPVYEVRPGIIATDMTAGVKEMYEKRVADGLIPAGYIGQPDHVAQAVVGLLRGSSIYATGTVINVDGGLSIPRL